ncbi:hypothetical protein GMDG_04612 [Pseudogymnoascus destructans 20631-21]|uniref:Uncharacterized protein n=1 Tax=Pseudogymnoascus destructans (strain ATCC MYA-4855 / 20631-21) TaxID=658429 RepID=L8GC33_PSED2|nr:hypothetical protein GMDG_04612 [Pseudogymnoascus destructans 20631-21]
MPMLHTKIYVDSRSYVMEQVKQWRSMLLKKLVTHVTIVVEKDQKVPGGMLKSCSKFEDLVLSFRGRYTTTNFMEVFYFVHRYVDIPSSTALGQYYCCELYAHICAKGKLMMDWEAKKGRAVDDKISRSKLVEFMSQFPLIERFDELKKEDFHELFNKTILNDDKIRPKISTLQAGVDYFLGAPPQQYSPSMSGLLRD